MKVYIDVSDLMKVDFVTGIQRAAREVVVRLLQNQRIEAVLLFCKNRQTRYHILRNDRFCDFFLHGKGEKEQIVSEKTCALEDMEAGSVFFDIDSTWNSHMLRSAVLPVLKNHGVKIAVYIYDVIPITFPRYCHENTTFFFMNYLAAFLQYADMIITSTQSTLDEINKLTEQLELPRIKGYVSWLGSDFIVSETAEEVSEEAKAVAEKGKYILCVGTIEPRKNHKLLLDAYDAALAKLGVNLVFAGKIGWNVEALNERIQTHPMRGKGLFHLSGQNDATIDYLYKNAFVVAFPTFEEGFGLPMTEAFERGCVLVASDIPVLREIGGDYCHYFNPHRPEDFVKIIRNYLDTPAVYQDMKEKVKRYVPVTWDEVAEKIESALMTLESRTHLEIPNVRQIVIHSTRVNRLLDTLSYIEQHMKFITEIVVCCPDNLAPTVKAQYKGNCTLVTLTDSEISAGHPLPENPAGRSFYLRCKALESDKIDDVFLMSDEDYRPLKEVSADTYYKDGRYLAYYCGDLEQWKGKPWEQASFDAVMRKTAEFLKNNKYPCKMYASHMPQVIDKKIFREMLKTHEGMEEKGYCEWCAYFNFLQFRYPDIVTVQPYRTMCWPASPTDWRMQIMPEDYLFENYCEQKKIRYQEMQNRYYNDQTMFEMYSQMYILEYREKPQIGCVVTDTWKKLVMPKYFVLRENGFVWVPFEIKADNKIVNAESTIEIYSYYSDGNGNTFYHAPVLRMPAKDCKFDFPMYGCNEIGTYQYHIEIVAGKVSFGNSASVIVVR